MMELTNYHLPISIPENTEIVPTQEDNCLPEKHAQTYTHTHTHTHTEIPHTPVSRFVPVLHHTVKSSFAVPSKVTLNNEHTHTNCLELYHSTLDLPLPNIHYIVQHMKVHVLLTMLLSNTANPTCQSTDVSW